MHSPEQTITSPKVTLRKTVGSPPADEVAAEIVNEPPPLAAEGCSNTFHTPGNEDVGDVDDDDDDDDEKTFNASSAEPVEPNSQPCSHSRGPLQDSHCVPFVKMGPSEHISNV